MNNCKMHRTPSGERYYISDQCLAYNGDMVLVKNLFIFVNIAENLQQMYFELDECSDDFDLYSRAERLKTVNMAGKLEQQHLQKYFEKYGNVECLNLYPYDNKRGIGYVIFTNPSDAAKALLDLYHNVGKCFVTVRPNHSWDQPNVEKMPIKLENVDPNEPPAAIMKLNDHCLEHIFLLLSVRDRINFARTCFHFCQIYKEMSPILDKSINFRLFKGWTVLNIRNFFQLSGRNIKNIAGSWLRYRTRYVCFYLGIYCSNLESIRITKCEAIDFEDNILSYFKNLKSLRNLELFETSLDDAHLRELKNMKQLKNLNLSDNLFITGQYMNCLPNSIESLTLNGCTDLNPRHLIKMLRRLTLLKELHLAINTKEPIIQGLFNEKSCASLEILSINYVNAELPEYTHIARLPNLKKLMLNVRSKPSSKLLTLLVEYKSKQLEQLEIRARSDWLKDEMLFEIGKLTALHTLILKFSKTITDRGLAALINLQELREINVMGNHKITDNGVLQLILACPKLHVLHLQYCVQLTEKLLHNIILKLESNQNNRPLPIRLYMFGTTVQRFRLLNAKYIIDYEYREEDDDGDDVDDDDDVDDVENNNNNNNDDYGDFVDNYDNN